MTEKMVDDICHCVMVLGFLRRRIQIIIRLPKLMLADTDREADRLGMSRGGYLIHLHENIGKAWLEKIKSDVAAFKKSTLGKQRA